MSKKLKRRKTDKLFYIIISNIQKFFMNARTFIGIMVVLALAGTCAMGYMLSHSFQDLNWLMIIMILAYLPLFFNNAWMLMHAVYYPFCRPKPFSEVTLDKIPKTAIIYFIRKESSGLFERLKYSFENNFIPNVDLWIVSGEGEQKYIDYEWDVIKRLRKVFGEDRVLRMHSDDPKNKKREMMDIWLDEYVDEYKYFFACDADSFLSKNTVLRLVRKAEHPDNKDIGCFQANTLVASACTYFANNNRRAVAILMEFYITVKQAIFKEILSFGHNYLCLTKAAVNLKIPEGMMSHDIWDTVYLRKRGYKTVFCYDVITYEESPANYIEERRRNIRWMKGDLESFLILFERNVCFEMWFQVYFNLHMYISMIAFFIIFNVGIFFTGNSNSWWNISMVLQYFMGYGILSIILFHRLIMIKNLRDIKEIFTEIGVSTLISLNTMLYAIIDLILVMSNKQKWSLWDPMNKDPREGLSWKAAARCLWPSTVVGLIWLAVLLDKGTLVIIYWASPILISFIFAIPISYFTSKEMKIRVAGSSLSIHQGHKQ